MSSICDLIHKPTKLLPNDSMRVVLSAFVYFVNKHEDDTKCYAVHQ